MQETPKAEAITSQADAGDGESVDVAAQLSAGHVPAGGARRRRDPATLLHNAQDIGFVVVAAHFVADGLVARFCQSISQVVEGSEAAAALQARLRAPAADEGSHEGATANADGLRSMQEPVQTSDDSGAWCKCLLQQSQTIACPGADAPIHLNTLLMQEFRPDGVWPVQELLAVLRDTKAVVILPPVHEMWLIW